MGNKNERPALLLTDQEVTEFINTGGFDDVHIREEFKGFMNDHPSGTMKKADLYQDYKNSLPFC